jgi:transposase
MNIHKNARLRPRSRARVVSLVASGQTAKAVGAAVGVCPRTVRKWVTRHEREGVGGLLDRSSRPRRLRQPTAPAVVDRIAALRRVWR